MYILGDICNTETKLCLVSKKDKILKKMIFTSKKINNTHLNHFFKKNKITSDKIDKILFCSVVPNTFKIIKNFLSKKTKVKCLEVKNLKPGRHKVQLKDGNNCFALNLKGEDEFTIKITEPLQLKITQLSLEEPTGYGLSNGHIEASLIGGTAPYSYTWFNNAGILTPSSLRIENLNKGTYTLKVEDSKGNAYFNVSVRKT